MTLRQPTPVDQYAGIQIREARRKRGVSQEDLAAALGITFQQVQKYENGSNRVSMGRLWEAARFLEMPVAWFLPADEQDAVAALLEELKTENARLTDLQGVFVADLRRTVDGFAVAAGV